VDVAAGKRSAIEKKSGKNEKIIGDETYTNLENYPNPFNPTTTITYSLPKKQEVKIRIYDPFGREIAELVKGVKSEGKHSVKFNGSNLASGDTITSGNYTETKKLMLLK
jgi:flagellar hook assembly protein FlgD